MNIIATTQAARCAVYRSAVQAGIPTRRVGTRIAACLSSLDDLITAQSEKIETLKTHKKGLMQQLFPAVDEDVKP